MKHLFHTGLFLLASVVLSYGQKKTSDFEKNYNDSTYNDYNKKSIALAEEQIIKLKSGVLIFLLHTKQNSIDALVAAGDKTTAEKVKQEQADLNKKFVASFKQNFTFCPVYFAYADDIEMLKNGNSSGLLLNNNLEKDTSIKIGNKYFLFGDYGTIYSQSAGFAGNSADTNFVEQGQNFRDNCLVIKDTYLLQLKKPFPYYESCNNISALNKKVSKLNNNLIDYFNEVASKKATK